MSRVSKPFAALSRVQTEVLAKVVGYIHREQLAKGARLTEVQLAQEIGVSRSPIRSVLRALESEGILSSGTERTGYYLARNATAIAPIGVQQDPSSDVALYDRIAQDRIREQSDQFTEAEFMRRYDVSRAQLVRTLSKMSQDGVVQRSTGQGWRFLPVLDSEESYAASYRFRLLIEPAALLEPTFTLDERAIMRSREAHDRILGLAGSRRLDGREVFETNAEFHEMLARMSGNRFIISAVEQQNRLRRLSEYFVYEDTQRIRILCREHCEIMDALSGGDQAWASTLLRRHLEIASRLTPPFDKLSRLKKKAALT